MFSDYQILNCYQRKLYSQELVGANDSIAFTTFSPSNKSSFLS